MSSSSRLARRQFLSTTALGSLAVLGAPAVLTASKTESPLVIGEGAYQYEVHHNWPQLPVEFSWQTTHGVAIDRAGCLYVIHQGMPDRKEHPSIFVFDPQGKFIRAFGQEFQGGGHGLEVREEDGEEFLYVCAYRNVKAIAKLSLDGKTIWKKGAPVESGVYKKGEDKTKDAKKGRDRFQPTNFAFFNNGDFLLADGYGSYFIHQYDKDGNWKSCFGGPGEGEGKFNTPHGLWIDKRPGKEPTLVVCDRANRTLQYLALDGTYQSTIKGFGLPANADTWQNLMVVPELEARLSILNEHNQVVARLGDDVARITAKENAKIRVQPEAWLPGKFVHPHDACFDHDGNIFVAEWVGTGRITKLKRLNA